MPTIGRHARIPTFPYAASLQGAWLDDLHLEEKSRQRDLVLDYQELRQEQAPEIYWREGWVRERVKGSYIPRRLRFTGVESLEMVGIYEDLGRASLDHPAREVHDLLRWIPPGDKRILHVLFHASSGEDHLRFYAPRFLAEDRPGRAASISLERNWSIPPPFRASLVPAPVRLYDHYGGDPIRIELGSKPYDRRLFIGGVSIQPRKRPAVTSVLNVGEQPSAWAADGKLADCDRWVKKGEGPDGMSLAEICDEASRVIERLKRGERVLVHCLAGMNRSSTICCAVLILLEGLSAEAALERVREHHPWARPDVYHWLKLRWLGKEILIGGAAS